MIDEDDDMNRRVRIIARTLALNNLTGVSGTVYWTDGELDEVMIYPTRAEQLPLIGNDHIKVRGALEQLINDVAADLDYAANNDYPSSSIELSIGANGSWAIGEAYTETQPGDNAYTKDGHVDLDHYDEEAA